MNVLVTSFSLILIGIAMIHPAFFLSVDKLVQDKIVTRKYLQTNYITHLTAGIISVLLYWLYSVNYPLQIAGLVYVGVILVVILFYWNSELTKWNLFTASTIFGFIVFYRSVNEIVEITPLWPGLMTGFLSSVALSILIFLMVEAVNGYIDNDTVQFRKKYFKIFYFIIGLRIAWQIIILSNLSVGTEYGETISAIIFFWQVNPIKLMFIILLGMIIPLIYIIALRKKVLSSKTRLRWLILAPLFISIFVAEMLIKYLLLQFGIVL